MDIPLIRLDHVFHVGSLDKADRGLSHRVSQEGSGLSVSLCPNAWADIAGLGDVMYEMTFPGAGFVDILSVKGPARAAIVAWATVAGYVEPTSQFRSWDWDPDGEEWRSSLHATADEAEAEVRFSMMLDDDEDLEDVKLPHRLPRGARRLVEPVAITSLTELGRRRAAGFGDGIDAWDFAVMFWAEDVLRPEDPTVMGVWWRERFAPELLSAPRGAIFDEAVSGFATRLCQMREVSDELELSGMPKSEKEVVQPTTSDALASFR